MTKTHRTEHGYGDKAGCAVMTHHIMMCVQLSNDTLNVYERNRKIEPTLVALYRLLLGNLRPISYLYPMQTRNGEENSWFLGIDRFTLDMLVRILCSEYYQSIWL